MKMNLNTHIEIEVEVQGTIIRKTPDKFNNSLGAWLPGEEGGIDDLKVFIHSGKDVLEITNFLDSDVLDDLEDKLYEEKEHA